jgi:hypothetical protein
MDDQVHTDAPELRPASGLKGRIIISFDTDKGYIGAGTTYPPRDGEDWERGNDLADGDLSEGTFARISRDIRDVVEGKRR